MTFLVLARRIWGGGQEFLFPPHNEPGGWSITCSCWISLHTQTHKFTIFVPMRKKLTRLEEQVHSLTIPSTSLACPSSATPAVPVPPPHGPVGAAFRPGHQFGPTGPGVPSTDQAR